MTVLTSDIIIIALAGFFSGIIKTGVGVGAGIFLLPTLALAFPAKVALGLGAPMMLVSDVIGLRYYWKQWLPRVELGRLFLAALPGLVLGVVLLPLIPGRTFRVCVGLFGACYALSLLWPGFPPAVALKRLVSGLNARCAGGETDRKLGAYAYGFLGGLSTGVLVLDILIAAVLCLVVTFVTMSVPHAVCARFKVEQVFKFYWTVVAGLAALSLILVWIGL